LGVKVSYGRVCLAGERQHKLSRGWAAEVNTVTGAITTHLPIAMSAA